MPRVLPESWPKNKPEYAAYQVGGVSMYLLAEHVVVYSPEQVDHNKTRSHGPARIHVATIDKVIAALELARETLEQDND